MPDETDAPRRSGPTPMRPVLPAAPRFAPLDVEEMTDEQREILTNQNGLLATNLRSTFIRHPALCRQWLAFGYTLGREGRVPQRLRELLVLRLAHLSGAAYEWGHHVAFGVQAGLTEEDIERVAAGPGAGWEGLDRHVLQACDDLLVHGMITAETWDALVAAGFDELQLIELPIIVGFFHLTCTLIASLGVQVPPGLPRLPPP